MAAAVKGLLPVVILALAAGCLPGAMAHFRAELTPFAECRIVRGVEECFAPAGGGTTIVATLSLDERGDDSRVFFREDTLIGTFDGDRLHVESSRELVREQSGCLTRRTLVLDGINDDPGLGLRREITGTFDESSVTDGDEQQCGRNVPQGTVTKYRLVAVEVSQP